MNAATQPWPETPQQRKERVEQMMAASDAPFVGKGKSDKVHLIEGKTRQVYQPIAICGTWVANKYRHAADGDSICQKCQRGIRTAFSTFNQPRECENCGKRYADNATRDNGELVCAECYEIAGIENEHQDGYHQDKPEPACPMCAATVIQGGWDAEAARPREITSGWPDGSAGD